MASTSIVSATTYGAEILQSRIPFSKRGGNPEEGRERIDEIARPRRKEAV
jgi:hypothetical protein